MKEWIFSWEKILFQTTVACRHSRCRQVHDLWLTWFNDERLRKIFREHFSAVTAQSVRVSSMIFFGSSNAVRNLRNDFPTSLGSQFQKRSSGLWMIFLRFGSPSRDEDGWARKGWKNISYAATSLYYDLYGSLKVSTTEEHLLADQSLWSGYNPIQYRHD